MNVPSTSAATAFIFLDALPQAYVHLDSEFRCTFANQAAEHLLGKNRAELLGSLLWDVHPDLDGTLFEETCRRAMAERVAVTAEGLRGSLQRYHVVTATPEPAGGIVIHLADLSDGQRAEATLQIESRVTRSVLSLIRFAPDHSLGELLQRTLDDVCNLTGSKVGFYHFVLEDQRTLSLQAWSTATLRDYCKAEGQGRHYDLDMAGVWGDCVRERRAIIHNDYQSLLNRKGLPPGHAEVTRELVVPVFKLDRIVAVLGVGNKPTEYDRQDLETVVRFADLAWDIAGRKRAEEALSESAEKHRAILRTAIDGYWLADTQGRLLEVNEAYCRMSGYSAEELLAMRIPDLEANETASDTAARIQKIIEQGQDRFESRHRRKDGSTFDVEVSVQYRPTTSTPMVAFLRDITSRKRAEEALRESEALLLDTGEMAKVGGWKLDIGTGQLTWSREVYRIHDVDDDFQLTVEGAIGFYTPESRPVIQKAVERAIEYGEPFDLELEILTAKRRRLWVHAIGRVQVRNGGRRVLSGTFQDVSTRKRVEEERDHLQLELAQIHKMESIGRLAGGVAHDFNNLLTVINGYSHMLLAELKVGDPLRGGIEQIHKAGERAAGLTRQLLAFSRKQVLEPRRLDVNRVVEDMRPMLERLVGEDVEVGVALHAQSGTINADPHQLEQVVMNLAVNARDAMPDGGKLLIETAKVEWDGSYTKSHPEARVGSYAMLAVSDTGAGMDEETKKRIFEPFFTTKGVGKGTGLGLSMVQGIVVQSGGFVEVYSEKGQGTTFKVYLPTLAEGATEAERLTEVPAFGGKETVLVVEDQAEVRKYAVAVLKSYGYRVIPVENAGEALLVCGREHIDLVLTDVVMPNVTGRELADRLGALRPAVKVLFMSGYTDKAIEHHGVLDEGAKFIQKPFSPEELAGKVRAVLGPPDAGG